MAYWDKGSKGTRNNGLPASLTDEFIKLDGEVGGCPACMWRGCLLPRGVAFCEQLVLSLLAAATPPGGEKRVHRTNTLWVEVFRGGKNAFFFL